MKKFLVLSAIVGLAGIGIALVGRQDEPAATVVESAAEAPTSTTAAPAASTSPTTLRVTTKAPAKVATTTTTQPAASSSPTTATTAAPVTTTPTAAPTTTTTAVATVSPTCTVSADNPSVSQGGSQTIRVTSNMPTTKVKIEMAYPKFNTGKPNPRQTYSPTTDSSGSVVQTFPVTNWSTEPVTVQVQFYAPTGGFLGGPACRTSFIATEG